MAENNSIGEISFGVNADTGELLASTKVVDSATTKMASSFQELTKKIAGTESGSSKLAAQFGGAGKAAAQLENEIKRLGGQVQANGNVVDQFGVRNAKLTATLAQLRGATFQTTSSFRMMRGGIQQLGYQIQDVAVQLQMGQNPLMILGQQGSQVASIFGAGGAVFGAILAISAAMGTALLPALFSGKDALEELTESAEKMGKAIDMKDGIAKFTDELEKITKRSREAGESFVASEILKGNQVIVDSIKSTSDAFGNVTTSIENASRIYRQYQALVEAGVEPTFVPDASGQMSDADIIFGNMQRIIGQLNHELSLTSEQSNRLLQSFLQVKESGTAESILNLEKALVNLHKETGTGNKEFGSFIDGLRGVFNATSDAAGIIAEAEASLGNFDEALSQNTKNALDAKNSYDKLVEGIIEEAATTGMSARQLALYNAEQLLTKAGLKDRIEAEKALINTEFDKIDATDDATEAEKARSQQIKSSTKSLNDQILAMATKLETLGMDEKELAKHTAMQIINANALDVNTEAVMQAIEQYYDLIKAKKDEIDVEKKARQERERAEKSFDDLKKSIEEELDVVSMGGGAHELFIRKIQIMGEAANKSSEEIAKLVAKANELNNLEEGKKASEKKSEAIADLEKELTLLQMRNSLNNTEYQTQLALMNLRSQGIELNEAEESQIGKMISEMEQLRVMAEITGDSLATTFGDIGVNALDSFSNAMASAIINSEDAGEALKGVARTILTELLAATIRYFAGQAVAYAASKMMETTAETAAIGAQTTAGLTAMGTITAANVSAGSASAAAWTPAAIAASIATFGAAPAAALPIFSGAVVGMATALGASSGIVAAAQGIGGAIGGALGGGRLYGGRTEAGKMHPILEDGKPEMLRMGNKNYLMTPQSGMVVSNKDMGSAGGSMQSNNINLSLNLSPNTPQEFRRQLFENQELVYSIVQRALNDRGRRF